MYSGKCRKTLPEVSDKGIFEKNSPHFSGKDEQKPHSS
jgi:hypothetical protein